MTLDIVKNPEKAPYMGSSFGQDVEPHGIYVTSRVKGDFIPEGWLVGKVTINKPLFIDVTNDTLVQWKYDLVKTYKAKGKKLSKKLFNLGYDAIITKYPEGYFGEIILLTDRNLVWLQKESVKKTKLIISEEVYKKLLMIESKDDILTPKEILKHINKHHSKGWEKKKYEDEEWINKYPFWKLEDIPVDSLKISAQHPSVAMKYSQNNVEDFPPIVVDSESRFILDGNYRALAAKLKGDSTIKGYVGYEN